MFRIVPISYKFECYLRATQYSWCSLTCTKMSSQSLMLYTFLLKFEGFSWSRDSPSMVWHSETAMHMVRLLYFKISIYNYIGHGAHGYHISYGTSVSYLPTRAHLHVSVFFLLDIRICVLVPSKINHSCIDLSVSSALKFVHICVLVPSAYSEVCVLVSSKIKPILSVSSALKFIQICVLVPSAYSGVLCPPHVFLMSFTG